MRVAMSRLGLPDRLQRHAFSARLVCTVEIPESARFTPYTAIPCRFPAPGSHAYPSSFSLGVVLPVDLTHPLLGLCARWESCFADKLTYRLIAQTIDASHAPWHCRSVSTRYAQAEPLEIRIAFACFPPGVVSGRHIRRPQCDPASRRKPRPAPSPWPQ